MFFNLCFTSFLQSLLLLFCGLIVLIVIILSSSGTKAHMFRKGSSFYLFCTGDYIFLPTFLRRIMARIPDKIQDINRSKETLKLAVRITDLGFLGTPDKFEQAEMIIVDSHVSLLSCVLFGGGVSLIHYFPC